jgi:uroporphyrinogen-III synthase
MVPQSRAISVLVTRPAPQAGRFVDAVIARYGPRALPIVTPLLEPRFLDTRLPTGVFGAVILTSETGVLAAARVMGSLPRRAFCVGDRTARVARQAGFDAISADGDADRLFTLLCQHPQAAPFLHLRGREARGDLVARLVQAGLPCADLMVYAQEPRTLTDAAKTALQAPHPVVVPLFSPRSAQMFREALGEVRARATLCLVALSPAVAQVFSDYPVGDIAVAASPTQAELFCAMDRFIITA